MNNCPNINTKEWKTMLFHLNGDEKEAYRAYIAHNYNIPPVVSLTEFKNIVGLKSGLYSSDQIKKINRKVKIYNYKNGTSHFIEYKPYGSGEMSLATVKFNYLPVNKQEQKDRDERRKMKGYGFMEDINSFEDVYIPSESEQEAGIFENGDFIPPLYFPPTTKKKKGPKFQALIESKEEDRNTLYKDKDKLILASKKTTNIEDKRIIASKLAKVNKRIDEIEDEIVHISNMDTLSSVEMYAEQDLNILEKIFNKPEPTRKDLLIAARLIKLWDNAGNFDGQNPHIFYDPDEFEGRDEGLKEVTEKFKRWRDIATSYYPKLFALEEKYTEQVVKETFKGVDSIDFQEPLPDLNVFWSNVLDISEVDNVLFQALHTWVKKANFAAQKEFDVIKNKIDELLSATNLRDFDIFKQSFSNDDDNKTGDLVQRFTREFYDWQDNLINKRYKAKKHISSNFQAYIEANNNLIEQFRNHTTFVDARIFFHDPEFTSSSKPTKEQIEKEEARLRNLLGDKGFEEYYQLAKKQVEEYKLQREAQKSFYEAEIENVSDEAFAAWEVSNSPYLYSELMEKGYNELTYQGKKSFPTFQFVTAIPKNENHYDNNFKRIEANQDYLNLYEYMLSVLEEMKLYFPNSKTHFMKMNSLPFLNKSVNEVFSDEGMSAAMSTFKDNVKKSVRIDDLSIVGQDEDKKELQVQMLQNNQKRINDYIIVRDTKHRDETGESPDPELVEKWRREAINEIAEEKSFDLDRVLKAYASAALTYKHKAMIEDQIMIMKKIIERGIERKENAAGEQMIDRNGNILAKKGLTNMRNTLEDFMDVAYWGYPSNKPEGKTKKRILTSDEKIAKEVLENSLESLKNLYEKGEIDDIEYAYRKDVIDDQLNSLGGVRVISKYGDLVLKYIQIKGMGWNFFAAFANVGFGLISNIIEASDGRNYSHNSFWKAQAMVLNSLPGINKVTPNGNKIRELMHYFDVLKESKNEIYKQSNTKLFKRIGDKLDWANPYAPQSRTEYMNQAPVMIAMMMDQKVTVEINGEKSEISLWEAYDTNGKLKEGVNLSEDEILDFKVRVDKLVKMNHGNYDPDSPIRLKRVFIGRAISQFRTWMFQGFAERFKGEFKDFQLKNLKNEKDFVVRKGRYLSYGKYWSYMQEQHGMLGISVVTNTLYQLFRKLTGKNTTYDEMIGSNFTEVDAANMRKNLTELVLYMFVTSLTLLLKASIEDDDDPKKKFAYYMLINQMGRMSTDIMFYTNPVEFERLARNSIPAFSLVIDSFKAMSSAWNLITGGEDILQSGPNKGRSKTWRDFKKNIPLTTQIEKIKSAGDQIYNK